MNFCKSRLQILSVLFFFCLTNAYGQEPNCVYLAADSYSGSFGSNPSGYFEFNGAIYYSCTGNVNGVELWKYEDGIPSMVVDLNPGLGSSMPNNFTYHQGEIFFSANNGTSGIELFKFDGVAVTMVADIFPGTNGSIPNGFLSVDDVLYFSANDGVSGFELWKYESGMVSMVADINPGSNSSSPAEMIEFDGEIFFTATTVDYGKELWKYDGITTTVFDIFPGTEGSDLGDLSTISAGLCFRATDGVTGYELWFYDGTSLINLDVNTTGHFTPWEIVTLNDEFFFRGFMAATGYELWKFDGVTASLVHDIRPGAGNSTPNNLIAVGNTLYFAANNGIVGNELWKYDGFSTTLVADIKPGSGSSMVAPSYDPFAFVGDLVFFVADDGSTGNEVWMSDGSNVVLGKDIVAGTGTSAPFGLKGIGDLLYFASDNGINGNELWAWNPNADLKDSLFVNVCDNFTSPSGTYYDVPGYYVFVDSVPSIVCPGCDSLIFVDLIIDDQPSSEIDVVACNEYTSPGGSYFNTVGDYTFDEVVPSISCPTVDSVITINLSIVGSINPAIVVFSGVIVSQQSGAIYQWLDCDNGHEPIIGATDQDFIPTQSGNYAVEITLGCTDTSNCYFVEVNSDVGVNTIDKSSIFLYPNPTNSVIQVGGNGLPLIKIRVMSVTGETVEIFYPNQLEFQIDLTDYQNAIYFVEVSTETEVSVLKILKN